MKLDRLMSEIQSRSEIVRVYKINPKIGFNSLEEEYDRLFKRSNPKRRPRVDIQNMTYQSSDFFIKGDGGHVELAKRWGLKLPADFVIFTSVYRNYMLAGSGSVRIDEAGAVEELTLGLRQAEDIPENSPHRLYYFASITGHPGMFAFRWNTDFDKMDIVVVRDYSATKEADLLGKHGDKYITDQTFTEWLNRMLTTDGSPLIPGAPKFLYSGLKLISRGL